MTRSTFASVTRYVAWRNLRDVRHAPTLILPTLLLPLLFLVAFSGALSRVTSLPKFPPVNYTAFQYVYALLQVAAFGGAVGGTAIIDDFDSGFMDRLMVAARLRSAIVAGFVIAMFVRSVIAVLVLTAVAFALGIKIGGSAVDLVGLFALAALLNVTATLWSSGVAMHVHTVNAAPGAILPIFLLLFLTPVFLPLDLLSGWLHTVANLNPLSHVLETGRGLIAGNPTKVARAFALAGGMALLAALWAVWGVRRAEAAGT
jgi:ABC-2 type transport system permease protein